MKKKKIPKAEVVLNNYICHRLIIILIYIGKKNIIYKLIK